MGEYLHHILVLHSPACGSCEPSPQITGTKEVQPSGAAYRRERGSGRPLTFGKDEGIMADIRIEDYNSLRHRNPMGWVDDVQAQRHWAAPSLNPYKVCLVSVCGFTFEFSSIPQLDLAIEYYSMEHHPSSRLPVYTENIGGDHWECQRWFEKLPQKLLQKSKRSRVLAALQQAREEYIKHPSANTGTKTKPVFQWKDKPNKVLNRTVAPAGATSG
jgi:hypothetical protein